MTHDIEPQNPPAIPVETGLDAHGFNPDDYHWVPVLKKRRHDGWSPERQREFIATLADTGSVTAAARAVGMSDTSCYRLRRSPGAESFAAAWDAAIVNATRRLTDVAFDRAISGVDEPVFNREGRVVGVRTRYNDRLLMFLMRAHVPERYGHVRTGGGPNPAPAGQGADGILPPPANPPAAVPAIPVTDAIARLDPVTPDEPHMLLPPDLREARMFSANMLDGELPRWAKDPDLFELRQPYRRSRMDDELQKIRDDELAKEEKRRKRNERRRQLRQQW